MGQADRRTVLGVPDPDRPIEPARDDPAAVGAEQGDPDGRPMRQPAARAGPAAVEVPDPDRAVGRSGDQAAPIAAELDPMDRAVVGQDRRDRLAAGEVPDPRRAVGRGGGDPSAVRVERRPEDRPGMREHALEDRTLVQERPDPESLRCVGVRVVAVEAERLGEPGQGARGVPFSIRRTPLATFIRTRRSRISSARASASNRAHALLLGG